MPLDRDNKGRSSGSSRVVMTAVAAPDALKPAVTIYNA